jgi:hypothetical protein
MLLDELQDQLEVTTKSGLWQVLKRLGISYQRARAYVHSPDPQYEEKLTYLQQVLSSYETGKTEVLFADQFTYYNHPGVNRAFAACKEQPKSRMAIAGARQRRVAACMNAFTAQVTFIQRQKITIPALVQLYQDVCQTYSKAETIYIVIDNWPVHYHPDVLDALVKQNNPFEFKLPRSWQHLKPKGKYAHLNLPIQLVSLPTYASWLNPIEKLWKWLKKDLIHQHSFAHLFKELFPIVDQFLHHFAQPSRELLSFSGLLKPDGLFAQSFRKAKPDFFQLGD